MVDSRQPENSPFSRYTKIEMRKSPSGYMKWTTLIILLVVAAFAFYKFSQTSPSNPVPVTNQTSPTATPQASSSASPAFGKIIKTSGCVSVNGLPDSQCTPGDIDPKVTQDNISQTICVSGYTKTVRPPVSYTNNLKVKQIQEYGYSDTSTKDYEEDHLISLELGGSPTSEANLWPEPYTITLNAKEKDKVENYLHEQVCSGKMKLLDAQTKIATNWEEVYNSLVTK